MSGGEGVLRVCVVGDSMIERWGSGCPSLEASLRRQYPQQAFEVFNHGAQGARVGSGLHGITQPTLDARGHKPTLAAVASRDPHLVIAESFAYAHRGDGPEGMAEYRDLLRRLRDEIAATTSARFLFALAPPPHRERFLDADPDFRNTSRAMRQRFADDVSLYLDEARRIGQDERWPIADAPAEVEKFLAGSSFPRRLVDGSDSLHPSPAGYDLFATVITRTVDFHRLVDAD